MKAVLILTLAASAVAAAQNPGPPGPPPGEPGGLGGPGAERSAQMMLARSAQLDLTDAQVVKLAAIARKAEVRQRTLRAQMDSGRTRFQPGDSAARRQFGERMRTSMEKERDLQRTDLRDAIAVLTPDQQARAWEMNSARARGGRGGRGGGQGMRGGRGMGPGMGRGMRGGGRGPMPGARRGPPGPDGFGPGRSGDRAAPDMPRRPGVMRPRMRPLEDGLPPVTTP